MKFKILMITFCFLTGLSATLNANADKLPGHTALDLYMPHHDKKARVNVFYPASKGGKQTLFGGGPTFKKIAVMEGAEITENQLPLVLYSHDWDGGLGPQSWVTADLAARGAITVHVDHINSLWGQNNIAESLKHWTRVDDLEVVLQFMLNNSKFTKYIDTTRIMVVGFGEGGLTALVAGGAKANLSAVVEACKKHKNEMRYCDEMLSKKVNLPGFSSEKWGASYKLDKVNSVAVIEPSLAFGFGKKQVENLVENVTLFSFKNGAQFDIATDVDESGLAQALPYSTRVNFNPAYRFSAALTCQSGAEEKLAEQGRYPVCTDPIGSNRNVIHKKIIDVLSNKLNIK